jgi:hypothetical protein
MIRRLASDRLNPMAKSDYLIVGPTTTDWLRVPAMACATRHAATSAGVAGVKAVRGDRDGCGAAPRRHAL